MEANRTRNNQMQIKPQPQTACGFSYGNRARGSCPGAFPSFLRRLLLSQILDAFPEATDQVPRHINKLNREIRPYWAWVQDVQRAGYDEMTEWFIIQASLYWEPCDKYVRAMARLKELKKMKKSIDIRASGKSYEELRVDEARAYPITNIITAVKKGGKFWAKCPFHGGGMERTASMVINKDNSYHCFSCNLHGDVIDFVMRLYGLNFVDAVFYLTK